MNYPDKQEEIIKTVEEYVTKLLDPTNLDIKGHDWKHAFRVRDLILHIAEKEGYASLFLAQVAALLHDIGRLKEHEVKLPHAQVSEQMVQEYLADKDWFSDQEKQELLYAIAHHSKGGATPLTQILQDADRLDGFGPIGIMRVIQDKWKMPDYDPVAIYTPFTFTKKQIDEFFENKRDGELVSSVLDFLGYHLSWYDNMNTQTGKELAKPLAEYVKNFIEAYQKQLKGIL